MASFFPTCNDQKQIYVVLVIFTTFFLLLATKQLNSEKTVSFNFPKFTQGEPTLNLQGSAKISDSGNLVLTIPTDPKEIVGRALYTKPVPIWDSTTGNVASFVTTFSFIFEDVESKTPADGLVFFLSPPNTKIPNNSAGGNLGVVDGLHAFNQFVGVEFDNYVNEWDPKHPHIGIDVNSLISLKTTTWNKVSSVSSNTWVKVSIAYDSLSKTLSVVVIGENGQITTVDQVVDLKDVLPETVSVGFSASTSKNARQIHLIHSWSFSSSLKTSNTNIINNIASS
uniref:Lectin n=1 Tax=Galega orientalis TaxID=47654 RepID=Q7X9F7_9FABA|nr:lectin [Galega orientalis]